MAWVAALAGGVMSYMGAKEQNKAAGKGGWMDVTTTNTPYEPSIDYRNWGMKQAYGALNGGEEPIWTKPPNKPPAFGGTPSGAGGSGGGTGGSGGGNAGGGSAFFKAPAVPKGGQQRPDGRIIDSSGKTIYTPPRGGRGGARGGRDGGIRGPALPDGGGFRAPSGPPGVNAGKKFNGSSGQTDYIVDQGIRQAQKGNPLYGEAEDYISRNLSGDTSVIPYADRAAAAFEADDPDLARLKEMLFADYQSAGNSTGTTKPGTFRGGGGYGAPAYMQTMNQTSGPSGGQLASREGPVGVVDDIQALLAGQGAPKGVKDAIERRNQEAWDKRIADMNSQFVGSNMMGSTPWQQNFQNAATTSSRELGDSLAMADYGLYQHGLDLGSQYDLETLGREAQERMAREQNATSTRNAGISASASGYGADQERASRLELAKLDMLQGAVGMGLQQRNARGEGLGSLADLYSQNQRFALGATPDITGLGMRDWSAAGNLSLGRDQGMNSYTANKDQAAAARAGVNATNNRLAFDRERWQHDLPLADLDKYMGIINSASGGYGSSRQFGQTPASGYYTNPGMAAVGGAAAGYSLGNSWQQTYGSGGGGNSGGQIPWGAGIGSNLA